MVRLRNFSPFGFAQGPGKVDVINEIAIPFGSAQGSLIVIDEKTEF